jgi:hypothetical protein
MQNYRCDESIKKQTLNWNVQGARRREIGNETWKRKVLEETGK